MRTAVLGGIVVLCSSAAFAQTAQPAAPTASTPAATARTITLSGCVAGGNNAQPVTLSNATVVPAAEQANASAPSPVPGGVSTPTTQQPTATAGATGVGATGSTGAAGTSGTAGVSGAAGAGATSGTAGTTGTAGATGTAATAGTAGTGSAGAAGSSTPATVVGSSGTVVGATGAVVGATGSSPNASAATPPGSSASTNAGYRLSGVDMSGWIGRRVQIVGTLTPAAAGASASGNAGAANGILPEFRVVSVQPMTGDCPRQ